MQFKLLLAIVHIVIFCVPPSLAQEEPRIVPQKINDNFYVLFGGNGQGSHVGMSIGNDGILLIDAMVEESSKKLLAAIREISDKPIKYVINTHSDFDHSGGNAFFAEMGATIIAQDNARFSNAPSQVKFKDGLTLTFNGEPILARHVISHSYDDLIIYLPESNILFMGDTFTNVWHPSFYAGSMVGQLEALDIAFSFANSETLVVPGHGNLADTNGLKAYREKSTDWLAQVGKLYRQGLSVDEMMQDTGLIGIKQSFMDDRNMPEMNFRRLIQRTLSVDFVSPYPLSIDNIEKYTGRYLFQDETPIEVVSDRGKFFLREEGNFMVEIIPLSNEEFHVKASLGDTISFDFTEDGTIAALTYHAAEEADTAKKIK